MKKALFFVLIITALAACKNDPKTPEGEETPSVTQTTPIRPPESGPIVGSKEPSPQTKAAVKYLTTGFWYIEAFVKIKDRQASLDNRGRWYQFAADGTFVGGKYKETGSTGVWTYDPQTALIYLDAENDAEDGEWRIQMGKSGTVMVWVGTERFGQNSIQIKLENYIELMAELPALSN